jgi:hypothetical protein
MEYTSTQHGHDNDFSTPFPGEEDPADNAIDELMLHDDVEVINRGPGQTQPFGTIEKNESRTDRGSLTGYGIELYDPDAEDDGPTDDPYRSVGNVSKNYLLVPNEEAVETAHDIIQASGLAHTPQKIFFDGKRFVYNTIFPELSAEGPLGDEMTVGLQVRNSYNGSMRFQAQLYAERLVCSNGMVSQKHFASHQFAHTKQNSGWTDEMEEAMSVLDQARPTLESFVEATQHLAQTTVDERELMALRAEDRGLGALPVSRFGEVFDQLTEETRSAEAESGFLGATGYDVLNAATNVLWHRNKSVTDLDYNEAVVDQLLDYAREHQN